MNDTVPAFFVVPDTNVWVYQSWIMRTPLGRSLLNTLVSGNGKLGLPEVCELELMKQVRRRGAELVDKIRDPAEGVCSLAQTGLPISCEGP